MQVEEFQRLITGGENSLVQFKENITNPLSTAQELVAFSNTEGGILIVGINDKTGSVTGLSYQDLQRINQLLVNVAQDGVKPSITIKTETVEFEGKKALVAHIPSGQAKPYKDKDGLIFVKNGSDKRKVTSNEELARLLQASGDLYAEEMQINSAPIPEELDILTFRPFFEEKYKESLPDEDIERVLDNLRLSQNKHLNLAGALLFSKHPKRVIPQFFITAIWFEGNEITSEIYKGSENFRGTLPLQYRYGLDFMKSKLESRQNRKDFNSLGDLEIPEIVLKELLVNALIHRDYFINDSIKILVFDNRIEIKSPGKLPNNLTETQIRRGLRRTRNTIISSFAPDVLPYRGTGSGILRALLAYPHIDFINDKEGDEFTAVIHRT